MTLPSESDKKYSEAIKYFKKLSNEKKTHLETEKLIY